ncbi:MAG: DUF3145 family protein [Micrococcales bacterium]
MTESVTGMVFIHSAARALHKHVAWSLSAALKTEVFLDWTPQPEIIDGFRTELSWRGTPDTGAELTSVLAGWQQLYFEVTQDPANGFSGSRWSFVPELGIAHNTIDDMGNLTIREDQMRSALERAGSNALELQREMRMLLAEPWDQMLEPLRAAGADARVVWLHRAG